MRRYKTQPVFLRPLRDEGGSSLLEIALLSAVIVVLVFIPLVTVILPQFKAGGIQINLYESFTPYTGGTTYLTNLDCESRMISRERRDVQTELKKIASELSTITGLQQFCGVFMKRYQRSRVARDDLLESQDENGHACATGMAQVPTDIVNEFDAKVNLDDGPGYGATIYRKDAQGVVTFAPLRLVPGKLPC